MRNVGTERNQSHFSEYAFRGLWMHSSLPLWVVVHVVCIVNTTSVHYRVSDWKVYPTFLSIEAQICVDTLSCSFVISLYAFGSIFSVSVYIQVDVLLFLLAEKTKIDGLTEMYKSSQKMAQTHSYNKETSFMFDLIFLHNIVRRSQARKCMCM